MKRIVIVANLILWQFVFSPHSHGSVTPSSVTPSSVTSNSARSSLPERAFVLDQNDDRSLSISLERAEGAIQTLEISLVDLLVKAKPERVEVFDIDFKAQRAYWAIDFFKVLSVLGVQADDLSQFQEVSFICDDGYTVNSSVDKLNSELGSPWLALASAESIAEKEKINGRWEPYKQGDKVIGFDPFYLIWKSELPEFENQARSYPWPYQLASVSFSLESDYSRLAPGKIGHSQSDGVFSGYQTFTEHCVRCHKLQGYDGVWVGGELGPELMRENGMITVLNDELLTELIVNVRAFYPQSAMPDFAELVSKKQASDVVRYLRVMKEAYSARSDH